MKGKAERITYSSAEAAENPRVRPMTIDRMFADKQLLARVPFDGSVGSNDVSSKSVRQAHGFDSAVPLPQWGAFEPFVDERVVARFLGIAPRRVLQMARKKDIPAHPIGGQRKTWRFRISEIDAHFSPCTDKPGPAMIGLAVPVTRERKRNG